MVLSSMEEEYIAACAASSEVVRLWKMLSGLFDL